MSAHLSSCSLRLLLLLGPDSTRWTRSRRRRCRPSSLPSTRTVGFTTAKPQGFLPHALRSEMTHSRLSCSLEPCLCRGCESIMHTPLAMRTDQRGSALLITACQLAARQGGYLCGRRAVRGSRFSVAPVPLLSGAGCAASKQLRRTGESPKEKNPSLTHRAQPIRLPNFAGEGLSRGGK